jgi:uncharacterized phage infection (PIP) family protein YhgE
MENDDFELLCNNFVTSNEQLEKALSIIGAYCKRLDDLNAEFERFELTAAKVSNQPFKDIVQALQTISKAISESNDHLRKMLIEIKTELAGVRKEISGLSTPIVSHLKLLDSKLSSVSNKLDNRLGSVESESGDSPSDVSDDIKEATTYDNSEDEWENW